ncbi:MAG: hypothetical protein ACLTZM_27120 [Ruminococcus sp.]
MKEDIKEPSKNVYPSWKSPEDSKNHSSPCAEKNRALCLPANSLNIVVLPILRLPYIVEIQIWNYYKIGMDDLARLISLS